MPVNGFTPPPRQRGPVQDESGAVDPLDALAAAVVEGRIVQPLPLSTDRDGARAARHGRPVDGWEEWPE